MQIFSAHYRLCGTRNVDFNGYKGQIKTMSCAISVNIQGFWITAFCMCITGCGDNQTVHSVDEVISNVNTSVNFTFDNENCETIKWTKFAKNSSYTVCNPVDNSDCYEQEVNYRVSALWQQKSILVYISTVLSDQIDLDNLFGDITANTGINLRLTTSRSEADILALTYSYERDRVADLDRELMITQKCRNHIVVNPDKNPFEFSCGLFSMPSQGSTITDAGKEMDLAPYLGGNVSVLYNHENFILPVDLHNKPFVNGEKPTNRVIKNEVALEKATCLIPATNNASLLKSYSYECFLKAMGVMGYWSLNDTYFTKYNAENSRVKNLSQDRYPEEELRCIKEIYKEEIYDK